MPDGNRNAALSASLPELAKFDLIDPYKATIQITVGYTGDDVELAHAIRARDLLPPKEAMPPGLEESMKAASDPGLGHAGMALYLHNLQNPAGDRFLAFLTEELHPFVASQYRVKSDDLGLFGHSYGGLFATYASLQKTTIFRSFGASSPGILPERSVIFKLYADALASGLSPRNLHMTVGTREITVPGIYQEGVGEGAVEFIHAAGTTPINGMNFSSALIENESHATMEAPAVHNFMRAFYLRRG